MAEAIREMLESHKVSPVILFDETEEHVEYNKRRFEKEPAMGQLNDKIAVSIVVPRTEPAASSNEIYLHVGNSGVNFKITDERGPTLNIGTSSFGNLVQDLKVFTNREGLFRLGEMLIKAAHGKFETKEYCHLAEIPHRGGGAGQTGVQEAKKE